MEQTNNLPSKFQIGDEVMYRNEIVKVMAVQFTEFKVLYGISVNDDNYVFVDSSDVSPVEKQDLPDTIIK